MAHLNRAVFTLVLALILNLTPQSMVFAQNLDSKRIKLGAWQSLIHCQKERSLFWSKLLEQVDPQSASLFRLAWLQVAQLSDSNLALRDPQTHQRSAHDSWLWTWNGELWADEMELWKQGGKSCIPKEFQVNFRQLPENPLHYLMMSQLKKIPQTIKPMRSVLRDYLLYLWG
jgi:hypothetical protein